MHQGIITKSTCQLGKAKTETLLNGGDQLEDIHRRLLDMQLAVLCRQMGECPQVAAVQGQVQTSHSPIQLATLNLEIFSLLSTSLEEKLSHAFDNQMEQNYQKLERQVQKYEQEIRNHISFEQQLKLYAEGLQSQVKDEDEPTEAQQLDSLRKDRDTATAAAERLTQENKILKEKVDAQGRMLAIYHQKESSLLSQHDNHSRHSQLLHNFTQLNSVISQQQVKHKIQNVKNFQNITAQNKDKQRLIDQAINFKQRQYQEKTQQQTLSAKQKKQVPSARSLDFQNQNLTHELYAANVYGDKTQSTISEIEKREKKHVPSTGRAAPKSTYAPLFIYLLPVLFYSIFKQLHRLNDSNKKNLLLNLLEQSKQHRQKAHSKSSRRTHKPLLT